MPKEKVQEFWKYYEQCVRRAERDSRLNGSTTGTVFLTDWDGFELRNYADEPGE